MIVLSGLIGGGVGLAYSYLKKPTYTAITTFVLEDERSSSGGFGSIAGLASIAGIDLGSGGGNIFQGDNIQELYKSRKMIEKTLLTSVAIGNKNQLLIDRYIDFNKMREKWSGKPELQGIRFSTRDTSKKNLNKFSRVQDSIIGVIVTDINKNYLNVVKPDKKLSIIKAEVVSKDEIFAKSFNEQIVKNVNDFYVQTKTKKAKDNVAILQQKTDSVRSVMNGAIYSAALVADATPNLNPTRQVQRTAPIQRSQFSAETNRAILSELVKNLELSKISLRKETPLIQVVDEPVFPLEINRIGKAKGILIGGALAGLLSIAILTLRRALKSIYIK
ncbi:lipopolysaccharide biosynthesis protein [Pedobacter chinensis]|uniref:lipopolysaccharide biosynthesis protein n=1 Tax=Pedobacter chinensis TaxID=2282421 RepID=UPI002936DF5A|nr:lipopolysaccharide biosynthesis protein [Pedobacter chinensis]